MIFYYESIKIYVFLFKLLKNNDYLLKMLLNFINIKSKYKLTKMAEYIVKSITIVFLAENSLKNLEKIKPIVCNNEVVVIIKNKS